MGNKTTTKKNTTTKRAAAKAAAPVVFTNDTPAPATVAKPKRVAAKPVAAKKPATAKKPAAAKTPRQRKVTAVAAGFTADDVALRAYFIAERRQQTGDPGTPEGDWLEAERQLLAELAK